MSDHLLGHRLSGHENARDVHLEHGVCIFRSVIQSRRFLLDSCCSNQAIESPLGLGYVANDLVELGYIAHIYLAVMERCSCLAVSFNYQAIAAVSLTQLFSSPLLNAIEVRGRLRQSIKRVDGSASLEQRLCLDQTEPSCSSCDQNDLCKDKSALKLASAELRLIVVEVELRKTLGRSQIAS